MSSIHTGIDLGPVFLAGIIFGAGIIVEIVVLPTIGALRSAMTTPARREQAAINRAFRRH